jgi:D-alanyl-D-alanine carboxypeptidase
MSKRFPAGGRVRSLGFGRFAAGVGLWLAAVSLVCGGAEAAAHKHHGRGHSLYTSRSAHASRSAHSSRSWRWQPNHKIFQLTAPEKDAALILDGETGRTLYARNADALRPTCCSSS